MINLSVIIYALADKEIVLLHMKVDLVVTLGGDGTVLWVSFKISLTKSISYISELRHIKSFGAMLSNLISVAVILCLESGICAFVFV